VDDPLIALELAVFGLSARPGLVGRTVLRRLLRVAG
jgi:hypothetical protein